MSKRILIVDDDRTNVRILEARLQEKGFDISCAYDGGEGLEKVKSVIPDLIILDVEMPEVNGYTFMLELHKLDEQYRAVPVIVLTAHEDKQPIFQLRGVKNYVVKPIDFDVLYLQIENLIINNRKLISDKIVIIEPSETQVKLMQHFLSREKIENISYSNTLEDGQAKIQAEQSNVVVLNFNTASSGIDGYALCKKLKDENPDLKIILLYTSADDCDEEKAKIAGADTCVVKTSDYLSLADAISSIS